MLTPSGPQCDVCGNYILPIGEERVNHFTVPGIKSELMCDNKCKAKVIDATNAGDFMLLPDGPLKRIFIENSKQ